MILYATIGILSIGLHFLARLLFNNFYINAPVAAKAVKTTTHYLQCYTLQEIADKVVKTQQAIAKNLEIQKNEKIPKVVKPPENLQDTTIWQLPKLDKDQLDLKHLTEEAEVMEVKAET